MECKRKHIVKIGLALLAQVSLPYTYRADAFISVVFFLNKLATHVLSWSTLWEKLYSKPLNYNDLHVFGCLCFPNLHPYNKHKLHFCSKSCTFLGYNNIKGINIWILMVVYVLQGIWSFMKLFFLILLILLLASFMQGPFGLRHFQSFNLLSGSFLVFLNHPWLQPFW